MGNLENQPRDINAAGRFLDAKLDKADKLFDLAFQQIIELLRQALNGFFSSLIGPLPLTFSRNGCGGLIICGFEGMATFLLI